METPDPIPVKPNRHRHAASGRLSKGCRAAASVRLNASWRLSEFVGGYCTGRSPSLEDHNARSAYRGNHDFSGVCKQAEETIRTGDDAQGCDDGGRRNLSKNVRIDHGVRLDART